MTSTRAVCLLPAAFLFALLPSPGSGQEAPKQPARVVNGTGVERVTTVDVLDRVERFATLSEAIAGLILDGLESMDHPMAHLETGLLRIHGPVPYRNFAQGIAELNALLEPDSEALEPTARRLVRLVVDHAERVLALETQLGNLSEALEQQREANRQAQEKLDALRRIDGTLESGPAPEPDSGNGDDDDGNGDGNP